MKSFMTQKTYLAGMFILTAFSILPGCSGGEAGGGHWNAPVASPPTVSDITAPRLTSTGILNGAINQPINSASTATFSEPMNPATLVSPATSYTIDETVGGVFVASVPGSVSYAGNTATFKPTVDLKPNTEYTSTISIAAKDLNGNALTAGVRPNPWTWTTLPVPGTDLVPPTVTGTNPADTAVNVAVDKTVNATFSKAMSLATITTANFKVAGVTGVVSYDVINNVATFKPSSNLAISTTYTATVTTGATDLGGIALATDRVWSFTTASTPLVSPKVNLLSVEPFGAAGGAGVTSCGNTLINGDISTTSASTLITGLTDGNGLGNPYTIAGCPGIVNGKIYTAPPAPGDAASMAIATQAQIDAQIAFDATSPASMPGGILQAAELGAQTLVPGVYTTGTDFAISLVDLTLDAQGDANAVWVFQTPSTLTVGTGRKVVLVNGALPKNIFWHVSSAATINAGAEMKGTILAFAGVSMGTGATLDGRAISLVGGPVTLLSNIITVPAP